MYRQLEERQAATGKRRQRCPSGVEATVLFWLTSIYVAPDWKLETTLNLVLLLF